MLATGGGGGDIGKRIGHGGGDGGDDDGDDDDYFDDFDEGEEEGGLFRRRIVVQELFNREFVEAVLQEWYKTMSDLPTGLRQACEMGLVSSAQMVRYLSIFARPTNARSFSRALPGWLSRGLVGRTLADPSFPHKMSLEFIATIASSIWCEMNIRKERFKQEWDLVIVNALTAACCNLMVLGLLAPCRSYASTSRFDFQNAIEKLPNNIFEKSYPLREFDLAKRISAFFYKAAELSLVGFVAGSVQGGMSIVLSARKERRLMNIQIGEASRRTWLGEEADPQYSDRLLRAYKRPVEVDADQSRWFISKDAIVSGLGLLGIKQGGPEATFSKSRRKRVIRKKVTSG
ncbi:Protein RETICULATA-RELATED 3 chloroplastic [Zea mays]|uniref:Protein RETICULATA-RELATED 3 chloroplastic n=1 Tax=Zea mays TaxID=4577 RepID=A0A1D6MTS6_MAIZE|nr:Protein RETICULATA-RELATED 3 chloroplastic [Zea mays]